MKKLLDFVTDKVILLADLVRLQIRKMEKKMYGLGLPAPFGGLVLLTGICAAAAGVVMLAVPGPGMVTIAFGIALVRIGYNILTGKTKQKEL